jgi:hypothetical protein
MVGAAIGAGGAVPAQIVASIFTARRETDRLKWDKQRQDTEWELQKDERFLALKQDLYANFAAVASGTNSASTQYSASIERCRSRREKFVISTTTTVAKTWRSSR